MVKEYKTRKRKLKVGRVIFVSLIMWLSILGFLSLFSSSEAKSKEEFSYKKYIVSSGETLWNIAKLEKKNNDYLKNKDIYEIIYLIKKDNNLQSDIIYENQRLLIKTY